MTARRLLLALAAVLATAVAPGAAHAVTATNTLASAPAITGAGPHAVAYDTDGATLESGEP
ncbi:MAG TPA: hypothetical protein VFS00_29050, partial [Polyangiaceae bacterium]|nr:hypothetical protein [Polyangiaceae bacterium]